MKAKDAKQCKTASKDAGVPELAAKKCNGELKCKGCPCPMKVKGFCQAAKYATLNPALTGKYVR